MKRLNLIVVSCALLLVACSTGPSRQEASVKALEELTFEDFQTLLDASAKDFAAASAAAEEARVEITMFDSTIIDQRTYAHSEPSKDGEYLIIVTPFPSMENIHDVFETLKRYAEGIDCSEFWMSDISELELNERLHSDVFTKDSRGIVDTANSRAIFHAHCTHLNVRPRPHASR